MRLSYFIVLLALMVIRGNAQPRAYSVANAHSHNDYEQSQPFTGAWAAGFGSIEADIFYLAGEKNLLVAHSPAELKQFHRSLDSLYLRPLVSIVTHYHGYPYADTATQLQLLIDIKTEAVSTLAMLVSTIKRYPELATNAHIHFVISGNRPAPADFGNYPDFIRFDGNLAQAYEPSALSKIDMLSADFSKITTWKGTEAIDTSSFRRLQTLTAGGHANHKTVRLWGSPDTELAWKMLMQLGVDYINTDRIAALADFLKQHH